MTATLDDEKADLRRVNAELQRKLDERTRERDEAFAQKTAMAEVMEVINCSPGDLAPVFDAMLEKATRLCDAPSGIFWIFDGEYSRAAAVYGIPDRYADYLRQPIPLDPATGLGRVRQGERVAVSLDLAADQPYLAGNPQRRAFVDLGRARSAVRVPLIKDSKLLGIFTVYRREVRPFTDKQIGLLQNFAAQAVIAMENARLLTETREALEQQTATAEVLQVINSSPGDLTPVFDAMLEKAMRLCEAPFGALRRFDGSVFRAVVARATSGPIARGLGEPVTPDPGSASERMVQGENVVHIPDVIDTEEYRSGVASRLKLVEWTGARTALWVALRKTDVLLGDFVFYRKEVRPFSDKQIALLQNFAEQAVIAIENARLLTETREALEQQTATAEVLQVINSSPGDLIPVFASILDKAHSLCGADQGVLFTYDGDCFWPVAAHGVSEEFNELMRDGFRPSPGNPFTSVRNGEPLVHISDIRQVAAEHPDDPGLRLAVEIGLRTFLIVPLYKDDVLLGVITANRREVRPFSDKQISLLQNFAAQAVIAMENARLLTETREALEQQTATAEVLEVINSSPGDLGPVFDAMLEKALRLSGSAFGILNVFDGQSFQGVAMRGVPPAFAEFRAGNPAGLGAGTAPARILAGEDLVHNLDLMAEEAYRSGDPYRRAIVDLGGARSHLAVALRKDNILLGMLTVYRQEVRAFSGKEIALLQNFAAQAVIAMENARLITETREALEQQTATAEVLQVINSSPGDLAPVFDAILEKAHTLCEAASGALVIVDGDKFRAVADRGHSEPFADHLRRGFPLSGGFLIKRLHDGESVVHIRDLEELDDPAARLIFEQSGNRTVLAVPLRKEKKLFGMIVADRQEVRPFADKQIALFQNFAAQAVIAMENARLLTETREALEQQTATAEVLQVINSSPGNLTPVFDAMIDRAAHLCEAAFGSLFTYDGGRFQAVALRRVPPQFAKILQAPFRPDPGTAHMQLVQGEPFVHIEDLAVALRTGPLRQALIEIGGARTLLGVPLVKDGALVGAFMIYRQEVRPFSDKQVALLQNFAAQAVIAMENARLITETREALEQQTATAEVLQVVNSSPGDLAPVFDAMLEKATRLGEAAVGSFWTFDGVAFRVMASTLRDADTTVRPTPNSGLGRIAQGENVVHTLDVAD